jgi:hypothetical protein
MKRKGHWVPCELREATAIRVCGNIFCGPKKVRLHEREVELRLDQFSNWSSVQQGMFELCDIQPVKWHAEMPTETVGEIVGRCDSSGMFNRDDLASISIAVEPEFIGLLPLGAKLKVVQVLEGDES